jgi:hypothetical protein
MRTLIAAALVCALPFAASADDDEGEEAEALGLAGLLSAGNRQTLPPILLSAGEPLAEAPLRLKSGTYYKLEIEADGSQELALEGPGFFRAIWIDEIVIEGLEIRPFGIESVEFDRDGTMEIGFVAIRPGAYFLRVPGSTGETQRLEITIE